MKSARAAAITADRCFTTSDRDTSAGMMETYDNLWHSRVAPNARMRLLMTQLLYLAENDRYDTLIRDLKQLSHSTLASANNGEIRDMLKLIHREDIPLLKEFVKERLGIGI